MMNKNLDIFYKTYAFKFLQTNQMMELKRQEIIEMEKRSLPVRHYLMKYILPNITEGLVEMTKLRPENPTEYLVR